MASLIVLFVYGAGIAITSTVAYFVIKKAVKDALTEYNNENYGKSL